MYIMKYVYIYIYKLICNSILECEAFRHNLCIIIIKFCTMCIIYVIRHYFQRIFLFIVF